ncbi:MAG: HAMP domain-containing sensor histidine kinase [Nitrospirae bacterium]|nr:HAMP domain-containing sensor histidine kinase [Nitrospirota bacterium]MDA1304606.1 HAMP domain-containing sensor histidine kinase [Nitrospirota bacterium]
MSLLHPIATKLGIAIDRAHAYLELEGLTRTLERRVQERTEELQTANDRLKDLDRLKSTFVSIASHELRTPLTSIKVFVENLFRGIYGPMTPEQTQQLGRVRINVDRLRRMISELLDLTQIETGRMKLTLSSVSLVEVVQEAIDDLSSLAREKTLALRCSSPIEVPCVVGDRDKLFQILTNLIHNAVKFTPETGEIIISIICRADRKLVVSVADTGCGISPEELGNIFLPFYRTGNNTSNNRGAGLGLALSRHLVELHKGHLWAESTPHQGSRFSFTLPVEPQPNPAMV